LRVTRDHKLVEEWELVLVSQGLSPTVWESPDGLVLSVPEHEVKKAQAGLSAYESENPKKPLELAEPVESPNWLSGIVVAALLLLFFSVTTVLSPTLPWFERGSANAQRILEGELWRTVTALTLHADSVHAVSNAVAAILFVSVVSGMLGVGLSSALVLLAGAAWFVVDDPASTDGLAALDQAGRRTGVPLKAGAMASDNRRYAAAGLPAIGIGMGMPGYQTPAETPDRVESRTLLASAELVMATVRNLTSG
jgi:hypothetical protein